VKADLVLGVYLLELSHEGGLCTGRRFCFRSVVFSARRGLFGTGLLQPGDFSLSGSQLPAQVIDQSYQLAVR